MLTTLEKNLTHAREKRPDLGGDIQRSVPEPIAPVILRAVGRMLTGSTAGVAMARCSRTEGDTSSLFGLLALLAIAVALATLPTEPRKGSWIA